MRKKLGTIGSLCVAASVHCLGLGLGLAQMVSPDPCSPLKTKHVGVIRGNGHDGPRNATATNLNALAQQVGFRISPDIDANTLNDNNLAQYDVLVFNYVFNLQSNDIINSNAKSAFMRWLRKGKKGFVGYHTSGALEWAQNEWRSFQDSVTGMRYALHGSGTPQGTIEKTKDPAILAQSIMKGLDDRFTGADEWYEYNNDSKIIEPDASWKPEHRWKIMYNLISVGSPRTPPPPNHPAAWFREDELGTRFFYTSIIHTSEGANSNFFKSLLLRALEYTAGPTPAPPPVGCTPVGISDNKGGPVYRSNFSYVSRSRLLYIDVEGKYVLSIWSPNGDRLYASAGLGVQTFAPEPLKKPGLYILSIETNGRIHHQKILIQ